MTKQDIILWALLVLYITVWTTLAYCMVGSYTEVCIIEWHFPLSVFCMLCVPAVMGFFIGLDAGSE